MNLFAKGNLKSKVEVLVIPVKQVSKGKEETEPVWATDLPELKELKKENEHLFKSKAFKAAAFEMLCLYPAKGPRIVLLGLGKEPSSLVVREAGVKLSGLLCCKKWKEAGVVVPDEVSDRAFFEGLALGNYHFDEYKSSPKDRQSLVKKIFLIGKVDMKRAEHAQVVAEGCHWARDLVNQNAREITPSYLAKLAKEMPKRFKKVKTEVWDEARCKKEGMGLFLAVAQGAAEKPAFIMIEYRGDPKSKQWKALIGKGVTFDTGGINLKPTGSIETMKMDMAGSAAVLGAIKSIAQLDLKCNVVAVVGATENAIGSKAYKPGDVFTAHNGKTVEIGNTDAEGRLVLADAISVTCKRYQPSHMVNVATLTGAIVIALGSHLAGVMGNDEGLIEELRASGEASGERIWPLPLEDSYTKQLKSDIADLNNIGGREAGSITAGCFLKEFVSKSKWAHLDIAGVGRLKAEQGIHSKFGTGFGARLLVDWIESTL